ncbi:universal stress protein [Actinophytocola sp.]|uniref:universal stress protein n=1 Tax=Actinophytocola sp. TaxID=1872138 RepID=UPI002D7FFF20|nr:universal stress protein [Actinophytocola sp.]HET9142282.1 universal stress protein [Actinophytocola sp.]
MSGTRPAVVVGVDGSRSALDATRWAAREAMLRKLPLQVVHACPPLAIAHPTTLAGQAAYLEAMRDQGGHWGREAAVEAGKVAPGIEVSVVSRVGGAHEVLIAESHGAHLVVLGSRGQGGFDELAVGSVALALAEHGACPVVVVRGRTPADPPPGEGPVLVGVDGSPASVAAIGFAFEAASLRGAELIAVHTWEPVFFDGAWTALPLDADPTELAERERRVLGEVLAGWQERYPDVAVRRRLVRDRPVRALLAEAQRVGAQLIVVGSRGHGEAMTGMGMGSTSRALLYHAECPVAVARPDTEVHRKGQS